MSTPQQRSWIEDGTEALRNFGVRNKGAALDIEVVRVGIASPEMAAGLPLLNPLSWNAGAMHIVAKQPLAPDVYLSRWLARAAKVRTNHDAEGLLTELWNASAPQAVFDDILKMEVIYAAHLRAGRPVRPPTTRAGQGKIAGVPASRPGLEVWARKCADLGYEIQPALFNPDLAKTKAGREMLSFELIKCLAKGVTPFKDVKRKVQSPGDYLLRIMGRLSNDQNMAWEEAGGALQPGYNSVAAIRRHFPYFSAAPDRSPFWEPLMDCALFVVDDAALALHREERPDLCAAIEARRLRNELSAEAPKDLAPDSTGL